MGETARIELVFSDVKGVRSAVDISRSMISVFFSNNYSFLPFADMEMENSGGWRHYPERYVKHEEISSFRSLLHEYRQMYRDIRRNRDHHYEEAKKLIYNISKNYSDHSFELTGFSIMTDGRYYQNRYYEDFVPMFCFLLSTADPDITYEGMFSISDPDSNSKYSTVITHIIYNGTTLKFEQMLGNPVYHTLITTWTRKDDVYIKSAKEFPFIQVGLITEDRDKVEQDEEINRWISDLNTQGRTMACAGLYISDPSIDPYPRIMIQASSRELCEKTHDDLRSLLKNKGYSTRFFSIYDPNRFADSKAVIPESATKIGDNAFKNRNDIKSFIIPDNISEIGEKAFEGCSSLADIVIPDSVKKIDSFAFLGCSYLKSVNLPKKLKKLNSGIFCQCSKLNDIAIPDSVTEIDRFAFSYCRSLTDITIPEKVRFIDEEAFHDCINLKHIIIPENVTKIGKDTFKNCHPDLTIQGKKDSTAEEYARKNGIRFDTIPENS